jgi:hypothetical protein
MRFAADSDSDLSRGYCACLVAALDGAKPEDVLAVDPADPDLAPLGAGITAARSRASTWHNVLVGMQKRARTAIAAREGRHPGKPFPSLVIARDGAVRAQGSYAEAQVSSFIRSSWSVDLSGVGYMNVRGTSFFFFFSFDTCSWYCWSRTTCYMNVRGTIGLMNEKTWLVSTSGEFRPCLVPNKF